MKIKKVILKDSAICRIGYTPKIYYRLVQYVGGLFGIQRRGSKGSGEGQSWEDVQGVESEYIDNVLDYWAGPRYYGLSIAPYQSRRELWRIYG